MLRVNQLIGFGSFAGQGLIEVSITASEDDVDVFAKADAVGNPAMDFPGGIVNVYLSNNVIVGASTTGAPGLVGGTGWGNGWTIYIIVQGTDSARIQGAGGDGGDGVFSSSTGQGGGGGGGQGTQPGTGGTADTLSGAGEGTDGTAEAAGTGGAGTPSTGLADIAAGAGSAGGTALEATDGGPDIHLAPESGATLEVWGGGGGGGGGGANGAGGNGGGKGAAGSAGSGTGSKSGGAAGAAYSQPGSASIVEDGPGTIDKQGA